jgi:drug/metabolite transporter (DMT)-like permease
VPILAQPVLDCAVSHARAVVALHVAVALFGFAGLFGAWLDLAPASITLGRCAIAALALWSVTRWRGERVPPSVPLFVNGAILALHWASFFAAIKASGIAIGLLGYATFPLFVVLLERVLLGRPFDRVSVATMVLVTAGLAVVAGAGASAGASEAAGGSAAGLAWGVVSGATFAWLAIRNRAHVRTVPASALALWQNAFAALWLMPIVLAGADARWPTPGEWALVAVLGVACTALAHTLFIASLRTLSAHTASVIAALEPVYGIALAAVLVHQVPTAATLAGGALIVAAAFVASGRGRAPV